MSRARRTAWVLAGALAMALAVAWAVATQAISCPAGLAWLALLALALIAFALSSQRAWDRALQATVNQARALEQGRFVEGEEPGQSELQLLTRSMNAMVRRLRDIFAAQAEQVALLQRQAQIDAVTGVALRPHFLGQLQQRLAEPGGPGSALILLRVLRLDGLNARRGHEDTDRLLATMAQLLLTYVDRVPGAFAGRLNGSDFALCLPVAGVAGETCASLHETLAAAPLLRSAGVELAIGAADGLCNTGAGAALASADAALARAEAAHDALEPGSGFVVEQQGDLVADAAGARAWREQISAALTDGRAQLAEFPLVDRAGRLMHLECPLRVQLSPGGPYQAAARWLALARRSRLMPRVDLVAVELALKSIAQDGRPRAVHAARASLAEPGFIAEVTRRLGAAPQAARQLSIECVEGVLRAEHVPLADAAAAWRPLGVRVGVVHAGASPHALPALQASVVDYVKVDARHLRGVAQDGAVRGYAQSLVALIHGLGLLALAEGVAEADDLAQLWDLGFDGATGPAVTA